MFTAIRLYFTHDLTRQLNPFLNDFLSDSGEIIPGAYTKTKKKEILASETHLKECWFFSLVYIYADVVNGIFGITSRGGDGKKGQDGGDGAAGRDSGHKVGMLFMFLNFLYKAFSLTRSAKLQINWNEKRFLHKKGSTHTGLVWDTNMGRQNWFAHFLLNANGILIPSKLFHSIHGLLLKMNPTKLASSQCKSLHSSIRKSTAAITQRPWVFFLGGGELIYNCLNLQLPLRRSWLHLN